MLKILPELTPLKKCADTVAIYIRVNKVPQLSSLFFISLTLLALMRVLPSNRFQLCMHAGKLTLMSKGFVACH